MCRVMSLNFYFCAKLVFKVIFLVWIDDFDGVHIIGELLSTQNYSKGT